MGAIPASGRNSFEAITCEECGKIIPKGVSYFSAGTAFNSHGTFCSRGCVASYEARMQAEREARQAKHDQKKAAKAQKSEQNAQKKEAKKEKAAAAAEITSDMNLAQVSKICLIGGIAGAHDFFVGKIGMGILKVAIIVLSIFMTISEKSAVPLVFIGVNLVLWGLDIVALKAKRFTDGKGHTIRE